MTAAQETRIAEIRKEAKTYGGPLALLQFVEELCLMVESTPKKKVKPATGIVDPKKAFILWYCKQYTEAGLGELLITAWPKEMKIAERILKLPLEKPELARRVKVFLNDKESDWIRGKARSMGLFLTAVNNYDIKVYSQRHEKVALGGKVVYGENEPTVLR